MHVQLPVCQLAIEKLPVIDSQLLYMYYMLYDKHV